MGSAPVRIACVGIGQWGKRILRVLCELDQCQVVRCCDTDPKALQEVSRAYPTVAITSDIGELLRDDRIDALILTIPTSLHHSLARQALEAAKHVFVEKPLALTAHEAEELVTLAKKHQRVLMVGHLLKYHPAVTYLKGVVDRGELGDIYYIYSSRLNLGQVRRDENALWSLAPHDLSVLLYLLGESPEEVAATGASYLQTHIEDVVFITLRFPKGVLAHVHVSWLDPHKVRQMTIVGSRKMAVFDDMASTEKIRIYDKGVDGIGRTQVLGNFLQVRTGAIHIPAVGLEEPLWHECRRFVEHVRGTSVSRDGADGADGLAVVRIIEAAMESLRQGGVPVRLHAHEVAR